MKVWGRGYGVRIVGLRNRLGHLRIEGIEFVVWRLRLRVGY